PAAHPGRHRIHRRRAVPRARPGGAGPHEADLLPPQGPGAFAGHDRRRPARRLLGRPLPPGAGRAPARVARRPQRLKGGPAMAFASPAYAEEVARYDCDRDDLMDAAERALDVLGWSGGPAGPWRLSTGTGISFWSWGETVTVEVRRDSSVHVRSQCA